MICKLVKTLSGDEKCVVMIAAYTLYKMNICKLESVNVRFVGRHVWLNVFQCDSFIFFRGVATTDVDLTNVDINQCDGNFDTNDPFKGAFRGTHKCPRHTKVRYTPLTVLDLSFLRRCNLYYFFLS